MVPLLLQLLIDAAVLTCALWGWTLPSLWVVSLTCWNKQERHGLRTQTFPLAHLDSHITTNCGWAGTPFTPFSPVTLHCKRKKALLTMRDQTISHSKQTRMEYLSSVTIVNRTTWGTLKADMVVRTDVAFWLFFVDAPKALLQTRVHHFTSVCGCQPVRGSSLYGCRPWTDSLSVVETNCFQSLIVSISTGMVDVEPRCPLGHAWKGTFNKVRKASKKTYIMMVWATGLHKSPSI